MSVHDFLKSFLPVEANQEGYAAQSNGFDSLDDLPCAPFENQSALPMGSVDTALGASCLDSALAVIAQKLNEDEREADAFFGSSQANKSAATNEARKRVGDRTTQQRGAKSKLMDAKKSKLQLGGKHKQKVRPGLPPKGKLVMKAKVVKKPAAPSDKRPPVTSVPQMVTAAKKVIKVEVPKRRKDSDAEHQALVTALQPVTKELEQRRKLVREAMMAAYREAATVRNKLCKLLETLLAERDPQLRKTIRSVCERNSAAFDALLDVFASQLQGAEEQQAAPADQAVVAMASGRGDLHTALRLAAKASFQPTVDVCCDPRGCLAALCVKAVECACALAPALTAHVLELAVQLQIRNATADAAADADDEPQELSRLVSSPHFVGALLDRLIAVTHANLPSVTSQPVDTSLASVSADF